MCATLRCMSMRHQQQACSAGGCHSYVPQLLVTVSYQNCLAQLLETIARRCCLPQLLIMRLPHLLIMYLPQLLCTCRSYYALAAVAYLSCCILRPGSRIHHVAPQGGSPADAAPNRDVAADVDVDVGAWSEAHPGSDASQLAKARSTSRVLRGIVIGVSAAGLLLLLASIGK